jgi:hypothetical protein
VTSAVSALTAPCPAEAFDVRDNASAAGFTLWYCDSTTGLEVGDPITVPAGATVTVCSQVGCPFGAGKNIAFIQGSGSFTAIVLPRRV